MAYSGVTRVIVLRALRAAGPPHSSKKLELLEDVTSYWVTITDGEDIALENIPPEVGRLLVDRLVYKWDVPRHWFYNPLMIPGDEESKPPS